MSKNASWKYPQGYDLTWIARDEAGRLAAFITAGEAPIPLCVLSAGEAELLTTESKALELPLTGAAKLHVNVPRPDDFIALAQRGLFVFDWRDAHRALKDRSGEYELVASPSVPVIDIDGSIANLVGVCALLVGVDLRELATVDVRTHFDVLTAQT